MVELTLEQIRKIKLDYEHKLIFLIEEFEEKSCMEVKKIEFPIYESHDSNPRRVKPGETLKGIGLLLERI